VTFLVDNQLPQALVRFLVSRGHKAEHVLDLGMDEANDQAIWDYAGKKRCVIVTKDEDFISLSLQTGAKHQVVWVRLGNCRTPALLAAFETALPKLTLALQQGDRVVELR
jgi:predicted nuclease of predicted toxin-antitoxin system